VESHAIATLQTTLHQPRTDPNVGVTAFLPDASRTPPTAMSQSSGSARLGWFGRLFRRPKHPCLAPSEFEAAFELETTRSERGGHSLALVVFAVRVGNDDRFQMDPLLEAIWARKRQFDTVGRLDTNRIGVLLPYTGSTGAWIFAEDVARRLGQGGIKVFTSVSSNEGDDDSGERVESPLPRMPKAKPVVAEEHDVEPATEPVVAEKAALASASSERAHAQFDMFSHFERGPSAAKRAIDVVGSAFALLMLSPVFAVTALAIKASSPGPVFFRQRRAGLLGRPFELIKFRSMYLDAEERKRELMHLNEMDGPAFKMKNDPRITPVGRWIRRLSVDEFPQFYNVLRGDMSLVGPRPPTLDELPEYERWHLRRLTRPGGLTCIWQTSGRNQIAFQEWMRMDMRYMKRASLATDAKLILKTFWTVGTGHGAC